MKIIRRIMSLILVVILIIGGCIFYGYKIEPYRVKTNSYDINNKVKSNNKVKVVQISDIHIKEDYTYKDFSKVVDKVNEQDPDIVVFTGDLYDNYSIYKDDVNVINELKRIKAKEGKLAVWGNRDYGGGSGNHFESIMNQADFEILKNDKKTISVNNSKLRFYGLDDTMLGKPEFIYRDFISSSYNILLSHEPDTVDEYKDLNFNLALSGHSHGGQINIPFILSINKKAIETTGLASKYSIGMYDLDNNKKLYVNTGIGTTHISFRFNVVPEVSVFNIEI